MADAFPSGVLVFDAANRTAVKMIAKTWLKSAKIRDVGAYFAVSDAKSELSLWDSRLQVTSRGYMLGYNDLRDPSVSGFFRFLAKVGDGMMKMQIVKIGFGGGKWRKAENVRRPCNEIHRYAHGDVDAVCAVLPKPADSGVRLRYEYGKSHHEKSKAEI